MTTIFHERSFVRFLCRTRIRVTKFTAERVFDRSEAIEKMLPPRAIPMDWDNDVEYPEEINGELTDLPFTPAAENEAPTDTFAFMREGFIEETMATILEVHNELPSRVE